MTTRKIDLCWITVSDIEKSKKFFTETVGLKVSVDSKEFGWVELSGTDKGAILGVAQAQKDCDTDKPGQNAIVTITVDNIAQTKKLFESRGVKFIGDIMEVPGQVKLVLFADLDGNKFQLVEHTKA